MASRLKIKIFWLLLATLHLVSLDAAGEPLSAAQKRQISAEVMTVLDQYMAAFNRLDIAAWEDTFHFPHYRLASGEMNVLNGPSGRSAEDLRKYLGDEWDHSAWLRRDIVHISADKVHVDTRFARYRKDGSEISAFDSLYVLTKEEGRWGIKLRSSMAP